MCTCPCWSSYGFAKERVKALLEATVPAKKRDASRVLGEDKFLAARNTISSAALSNCFSTADAVAHMRTFQPTDIEVLDPSFTLPAVINAYDGNFNAEGDRNLSDILPSAEIDVPSSSREVSTDICEKFFENSNDGPTKAIGVFKLGLRGLNTLAVQREVLSSMEQLHRAFW